MQNPLWSSSLQYPNAQPFFGIVETTVEALRLVHAARLGIIRRVIRRLNDRERNQMIVSGAVFVFSAQESGIRRWTDGRLFLSSRIDGNFLVYKELNERRGGPRNSNDTEGWISMSEEEGREIHPSAQGKQCSSRVSFVAANEDGIKVGGLVKRTITVKIHGSDYHVISYYTQEDVDSRRLGRISSRFDIMSLDLPPHIFTLSDFRFPPRVETGRDGLPKIVCEPGPFEPPNGHDTTRYPLARQMHRGRDVSRSGLVPDDAPGSPAIFHGSGMASSSNRVPADSWQEQYGYERTAAQTQIAQYSAQDVPWSSQAAPPEGRIADMFASTSEYQPQPPHFPHHNPFPTGFGTYLSSDRAESNDTLEMEQARELVDDVQCPNSGAPDISYLPFTHDPWPSSSAHPQSHAQVFIPGFQLSREQLGEEYEHNQ